MQCLYLFATHTARSRPFLQTNRWVGGGRKRRERVAATLCVGGEVRLHLHFDFEGSLINLVVCQGGSLNQKTAQLFATQHQRITESFCSLEAGPPSFSLYYCTVLSLLSSL